MAFNTLRKRRKLFLENRFLAVPLHDRCLPFWVSVRSIPLSIPLFSLFHVFADLPLLLLLLPKDSTYFLTTSGHFRRGHSSHVFVSFKFSFLQSHCFFYVLISSLIFSFFILSILVFCIQRLRYIHFYFKRSVPWFKFPFNIRNYYYYYRIKNSMYILLILLFKFLGKIQAQEFIFACGSDNSQV